MSRLDQPQVLNLDDRMRLPFGLYDVELPNDHGRVLIASANTFTELMRVVTTGMLPQDAEFMLLTPELITAAGNPEETVHPDLVLPMFYDFLEFTRRFPLGIFLLGTPVWNDNSHKPRNAVAVVQNGNVIQTIAKTYGTPGESKIFDLASPSGINNLSAAPSIGVLVCRDLAIDSSGIEFKRQELTCRECADEPNALMSPNTKVALVSSCWGVGSRIPWSMIKNISAVRSGKMTATEAANRNFSMALVLSASNLFDAYSELEVIIFADRTPLHAPLGEEDSITSSTPFNAVFLRSDWPK